MIAIIKYNSKSYFQEFSSLTTRIEVVCVGACEDARAEAVKGCGQ
jgi:hypothetical protein